jgi:hypothetical protein
MALTLTGCGLGGPKVTSYPGVYDETVAHWEGREPSRNISAEIDAKTDRAREWVTRGAPLLTPALRQKCIDQYKTQMNDPSSFQLAGELAASVGQTIIQMEVAEMERPDPKGGDKLVKGAPSPPIVAFIAPIRGKNAFGGLVLSQMKCIYLLNDTELLFGMTE